MTTFFRRISGDSAIISRGSCGMFGFRMKAETGSFGCGGAPRIYRSAMKYVARRIRQRY
jgi:hypothetical protein